MLNSKEFNDKLQSNNLKELEKDYQEAKSFFEAPDQELKCDDISKKFHAFYYDNGIVMIKFPTYKIRVVNGKVSQEELDEILKGIGRYEIYEEVNVFSYPEFDSVNSIAIHCLEDNLEANQSTAGKIEDKLKENDINCERWVSYGLHPILVKVNKEGKILLNVKQS